MERERPDYLPQIPRSRWEFPWMGMWALLLLGMAGAGIWLHLRTDDAWTARFVRSAKDPAPTPATNVEPPSPVSIDEAKKQAVIAEIRLRRAVAERDAEAKRKREELRCIGGVAFRRIPGGWENVPGESCP